MVALTRSHVRERVTDATQAHRTTLACDVHAELIRPSLLEVLWNPRCSDAMGQNQFDEGFCVGVRRRFRRALRLG